MKYIEQRTPFTYTSKNDKYLVLTMVIWESVNPSERGFYPHVNCQKEERRRVAEGTGGESAYFKTREQYKMSWEKLEVSWGQRLAWTPCGLFRGGWSRLAEMGVYVQKYPQRLVLRRVVTCAKWCFKKNQFVWGVQDVKGDIKGEKETDDCLIGTECGGCQEVDLAGVGGCCHQHQAGVPAFSLHSWQMTTEPGSRLLPTMPRRHLTSPAVVQQVLGEPGVLVKCFT